MKKSEMSLRTKQRMAASLKKQMRAKPFDKITVSEILSDCDITRPTFYYHFQDTYALLEWMLETEAIELLKRSDNCVTWDEGLLLMLEYIAENEEVCKCAYNSISRSAMERMFFDQTRNIMRCFTSQLQTQINAKPEHAEFISDFYTIAITGCYAKWLSTGLKRSPKEMIELLDITLHGNVAAALTRSAES